MSEAKCFGEQFFLAFFNEFGNLVDDFRLILSLNSTRYHSAIRIAIRT